MQSAEADEMETGENTDLESEDPIVKRARNLTSIGSYSLCQLSVGTDARQGFQDGASETVHNVHVIGGQLRMSRDDT